MAWSFKIKEDSRHATEAWDGDAIGGLCVLIGAVLGGIWLFFDWWKTRRENNSVDAVAQKIMESVKEADVRKLFDELEKLPDDKLNNILNVQLPDDSKFTPNVLKTDIDLHKKLVQFYATMVHPFRMKLTTFPPKDIANETGAYKSYVDGFVHNTVQYPEPSPKCEHDGYHFLPKNLLPLWEQLSKDIPTGSLLDVGWNKSNLKVLRDHILYFYYTIPKHYGSWKGQHQQFHMAVKRIVKAVGIEGGWWDESNSDSSEYLSIEGDDGIAAYTFGQAFGWFLERPYSLGVFFPAFSTMKMFAYICASAKRELKLK